LQELLLKRLLLHAVGQAEAAEAFDSLFPMS
jgi:hypothetical protein